MSEDEVRRLDCVAAIAEDSDSIDEWLDRLGWKPSKEEKRESIEIFKKHVQECPDGDKCSGGTSSTSDMCQYHEALWKSLVQEQLDVDEEKLEERKNQLSSQTFLSDREAELYVLTEEMRYSTVDASDYMNITENNAYGKRGDIKEKIQKAEKTAELSI